MRCGSSDGAEPTVNGGVEVRKSTRITGVRSPNAESPTRLCRVRVEPSLTPARRAPCADHNGTETTEVLPARVAPMTWTRLDDGWTDRPVFDEVSYDARWHYLALIQWCSRTSRYDGRIRAADARRCSDLPDPASALGELAAAGLVEVAADGAVTLPRIEEHIPPPSMRDETRKERQRAEKRRSRLHAKGNHVECLPESCEKAVSPESAGGSSPSRPVLSRPGVSTDVSADIPPERAARLDALARARAERGYEA